MKAAILLVSSHSTIVLLGADRQYLEEMDILLTRYFIRVFCLNVPSVSFQLQSQKKRQYL